MPPKHTSPDTDVESSRVSVSSTVDEVLREWKAMTRSHDPVEVETGKLLLDSYRDSRQADRRQGEPAEELPRARWAHVLSDLVGDHDERHWVSRDEFKTGHSQLHKSRSGTCLSVNVTKGLWYCSSPGCRLGGNVIRWVQVHGLPGEEQRDSLAPWADTYLYQQMLKLYGQPYAD